MGIENNLSSDKEGKEMFVPDGSTNIAESFIPASKLRPEHDFEGPRINLNDKSVVDQLRKGISGLPLDLFRALHRGERTALIVPALGGLILFVGFVEFKARGGQDALKFVDQLHKAKAKFRKDKNIILQESTDKKS